MAELALEYRALLEVGGLSLGRRPVGAAARLHRAGAGLLVGGGAAPLPARAADLRRLGDRRDRPGDGVRQPRRRRSGTGVMLTRAPDREPDVVEPHGDFVIQGQGDDVVGGVVETFPDQRAPAPLRARRRGGLARARLPRDPRAPSAEAAAGPGARPRDEPPGGGVHLRGRGPRGPLHPADARRDRGADLGRWWPSCPARSSTRRGWRPASAWAAARSAAASPTRRWTSSGCAGSSRASRSSCCGPTPFPTTSRSCSRSTACSRPSAGPPATRRWRPSASARPASSAPARLEVDERGSRSRIGGRAVATGDLLSISGIDGGVYLGAHPVAEVRVRGTGPAVTTTTGRPTTR